MGFLGQSGTHAGGRPQWLGTGSQESQWLYELEGLRDHTVNWKELGDRLSVI